MTYLSDDSLQTDSESASAPFRISPSVYFRYAFAGRKAAIISAICLAAVATLIAIWVISGDPRFLLVALIALFIGVPTTMSFIWFAIALSPEAAKSTLLHTVVVRKDGSLSIRWVPDEADGNNSDGSNVTKSHLPAPVIVPSSRIVSQRTSRSHLIYRLSTGELVIVPIDMINLNPQEICQFEDFA